MKVLRDVRADELNAWFQQATAAAAEQALRSGVRVVGTDEQGHIVEIQEPIEADVGHRPGPANR
jgi:hypothetical protein